MGEPFDLTGKSALVTGGGRGIGRAICLSLARAGAAVMVAELADRSALASEVVMQIRSTGRRASSVALDVRAAEQCNTAVAKTIEELGAIDILVNNAGVRLAKRAFETTREDLNLTLGVNLMGPFFCAVAAARYMSAQGEGRIVNVASQLALVGAVDRAAYVASKGGLVALTRALAVEWAPAGITVNAVGPGPTETALWDDDPRTLDERRGHLSRFSPIGRFLNADEIAGAIVYLASPSASGVTGHLLLVDGGWTAW